MAVICRSIGPSPTTTPLTSRPAAASSRITLTKRSGRLVRVTWPTNTKRVDVSVGCPFHSANWEASRPFGAYLARGLPGRPRRTAPHRPSLWTHPPPHAAPVSEEPVRNPSGTSASWLREVTDLVNQLGASGDA